MTIAGAMAMTAEEACSAHVAGRALNGRIRMSVSMIVGGGGRHLAQVTSRGPFHGMKTRMETGTSSRSNMGGGQAGLLVGWW